VIPNASHALIPEQPAAVVEAIVSWIGNLPQP
jgi:pimeloyl-ACP methyl ester carboxylesterase